jgi:prohibitin 2
MRNPFKGSDYPYGNRKRITPEGEPLEGSGVSRSLVKIVVPIIVGIIIIAVIAISSVRMVDAGNRGVLVQFGNVDTDVSLDDTPYHAIYRNSNFKSGRRDTNYSS